MGEKREKWIKEKQLRDAKKKRRQETRNARNRIRASGQTWADLKKRTENGKRRK